MVSFLLPYLYLLPTPSRYGSWNLKERSWFTLSGSTTLLGVEEDWCATWQEVA